MDVVVVVVFTCTKSSSSRCYYDALIMCNVCKEKEHPNLFSRVD